MSANLSFVSKYQQKEDDAGIPSLAPAQHVTKMMFASDQRVFDLHSQQRAYCRTFLYHTKLFYAAGWVPKTGVGFYMLVCVWCCDVEG